MKKIIKSLPKISIVTPSYNQGAFIEDTILSVLGQFYPNLEYMIFDGGSNDNTVEIIKKYDDKITFWSSEKDDGQANAINKAFSKCTGDIFMWLNSDDLLMPNILHFIAELYLKNGDAIYIGNCIHFEEKTPNGLFASGSNIVLNNQLSNLELADTIIQPSSFWSKKVWELNGILDEGLHFGFDWEWFLRAKKNNIKFYSFNKPLSLYRFHSAHKSGSGGSKRNDEILNIYKLYNTKYSKLYEKLITEKKSKSLFERIIYIICSRIVFYKKFTEGHYLKIIKFNSYKKFTIHEINMVMSML